MCRSGRTYAESMGRPLSTSLATTTLNANELQPSQAKNRATGPRTSVTVVISCGVVLVSPMASPGPVSTAPQSVTDRSPS